MENFIAAGIVLVLVGAVIFYLVREKKKGRKCVGCPYAKHCGAAEKISSGVDNIAGGCAQNSRYSRFFTASVNKL